MHKQRVAEVLSEPEAAREKQRSRESLTLSDTVKYESGPDGGEEVSMSVEWNGVSTNPLLCSPIIGQRALRLVYILSRDTFLSLDKTCTF